MKHFYYLFLLITSVAYAQLTPPSNLQSYYSDVDFNKTGLNLFDDLAVTTASKHTNYITYSNVWEADKITDEDPENSNNVLLIYGYNDNDGNYITDRSRSKTLNGGSQGTDWNREHTFPNSLAVPSLEDSGSNVPPYADAHNLRPSDVRMNNNRGNLLFAAGSGNAGNVSGNWYPGNEWKGDVARIIMYMYLRYGTQCKPAYTAVGTINNVDTNMINLLLQWNAEDNVSIIEDNRNTYHGNASNTYGQGNRNPFIDNPYLATLIWGGTTAQNRWSTLSTKNNAITEFKIYPNPVSDNLLKISTNKSVDSLNIEIFNILGTSVIKQKLNNNLKEINISTLKSGIYLVKFQSENGSVTKKLIKN